ncbi:MAG: hypothetical protein ACOX05_01805 [Bacillota bacterium]
MALNRKQQQFVRSYLLSGDAQKAAAEAGYTTRSVKRLLELPELADFLQTGDKVATLKEVLLYFSVLMRQGDDQKIRLKAAGQLAKYLGREGEKADLAGGLKIIYDYEKHDEGKL